MTQEEKRDDMLQKASCFDGKNLVQYGQTYAGHGSASQFPSEYAGQFYADSLEFGGASSQLAPRDAFGHNHVGE